MATFQIFLGLKRDLRAHGLGASNLWLHPSYDIEASFAARFTGRLPPKPLLFVSPTSLKDDSGKLAPKGSSTLVVLTYVPYAKFRKFQWLSPEERGAAYRAMQAELSRWMLAELEARCPGLVGDIAVCEYGTPLAAFERTRAVDGAPFGAAMTMSQWGPAGFRTRTPVPGLLLAGAGIFRGRRRSVRALGARGGGHGEARAPLTEINRLRPPSACQSSNPPKSPPPKSSPPKIPAVARVSHVARVTGAWLIGRREVGVLRNVLGRADRRPRRMDHVDHWRMHHVHERRDEHHVEHHPHRTRVIPRVRVVGGARRRERRLLGRLCPTASRQAPPRASARRSPRASQPSRRPRGAPRTTRTGASRSRGACCPRRAA